MTVKVFDPQTRQPVAFTRAAADKVKAIGQEKGQEELKLRLYITGGGCSGFQYGFTFAEQVEEEDTVVETDQVQLGIKNFNRHYRLEAELLEGNKHTIHGSHKCILYSNEGRELLV